MRNIALIGFMGAGKSTVAEILAKKLKLTLIETDGEILSMSDFSSINDIFDKKGEAYFREIEKNVIEEVVKHKSQVVSCGGGVVGSPESMELLKENAFVIFLHASFEAVKARLKSTATRPLFRQEEKAMLLYAERMPVYKRYADLIIDTDDKTPEEIVQIIIDKYKVNG